MKAQPTMCYKIRQYQEYSQLILKALSKSKRLKKQRWLCAGGLLTSCSAIVMTLNNTIVGDPDRYYQDVWDGIGRQSIYHNWQSPAPEHTEIFPLLSLCLSRKLKNCCCRSSSTICWHIKKKGKDELRTSSAKLNLKTKTLKTSLQTKIFWLLNNKVYLLMLYFYDNKK